MASEIKLVSVILPTYNEAGNIVDLVRAIDQAITQPHEIIVVDDNSPDGTSKLIQDVITQGSIPALKLETRLTDRGLTKSIQRGIDLAQGDTVVWLDCDFSMPPELVPDLVRNVQGGSDICVGSRFVPGGSFKKDTAGTQDSWLAVALSRFMNYTIQFFLARNFRDYTSGFIAARRSIFREIRLSGEYGEYFIDLIFRAIRKGYRIVEIPYVCVPRLEGYSKTGQNLIDYLRRGWKYVVVAFHLRFLALTGKI
jgi:dolichol-phosphate mannosyltransferase